MSERCYRDDELEALAALPPDDARLAHREQCGRCQALLATFREFQSPSLPAEAQSERAVAEITSAVERAIHGKTTEPTRVGILGRVGRMLGTPTLRPVWITAVAVLLILTVRQVFVPTEVSEIGSALRGESVGEEIGATAVSGEDGGLRISWQPVAGVNAYRVLILDLDLMEVERVDTGASTSVSLSARELASLPGHEAGLLWRVVALRDDREVARSPLHSIETNSP